MTKFNKKNQKQLDDEIWAELNSAADDSATLANLDQIGEYSANQPSQNGQLSQKNSAKKKQAAVLDASQATLSSNLNLNLDLKTGLVIGSYGQYSLVRVDAENLAEKYRYYECVNKGRQLDPVVGDYVQIEITSELQGRINEIQPRKNLLYRSDAYKSKAFASNLDALIWVIAPQPRFNHELLDRAMVAAQSIQIPLKIVVNKSDLDFTAIEPLLRIYKHLDYELCNLSKHDRAGVLHFFQQFHHQRVILLGQSGMGKSSLLNVLMPELNIKTREVSKVLNSGKHTTTHSKLYDIHVNEADGMGLNRLDFSLEMIDSPGFQIFGLHHLKHDDYLAGFREFNPFLGKCRFHNCKHLNEPDCAILKALQQGKINELRYQSYIKLCQEAHV